MENHEGGRQFAGSRHLTQAFRQGGIAPHSTDTEVQIELATVRHQTTIPATSATSTAGVRRPAPREAGAAHISSPAGVKRLKMADGSEHQVRFRVSRLRYIVCQLFRTVFTTIFGIAICLDDWD